MKTLHLLRGQRLFFVPFFCFTILLMSACQSVNEPQIAQEAVELEGEVVGGEEVPNPLANVTEQDGTVFYEIFVRSFYDSNNDGIGDLNGVTAKLDYLQELGVGGIWLMPIFESSTYHGYDTNNYYEINPDYGTKGDLKYLVEEAHKRDIKVIIDLVVNHTGKNHPWFQDALTDASSPYRDWYQFLPVQTVARSDSAAGTVAWHKTADGLEKYLGIFDSQMPDLNFDHVAVVDEIVNIAKYWIEETNIDGYRLDAAKHIFGDFKSNLYEPEIIQKNIAFWQTFRSAVDEIKEDVYLIGEVWDSTTYISYFLDEALNGAFNFDLAESIIGAVKDGRDADFGYVLQKTYSLYNRVSEGKPFIDAPFLTNHDQERVMSLLNGHLDKAKMAVNIMLTLPGNPYLYYGEEIGMMANKPDEDIREPMIWYENESGGSGQTTWKKANYNTGDNHVSVEQQEQDRTSLLNHYKNIISWRNSNQVLKNGDILEYKLAVKNTNLSVYIRATKTKRVLVMHNLSAIPQVAVLDNNSEYGLFELPFLGTAEAVINKNKVMIPPYTTVILE